MAASGERGAVQYLRKVAGSVVDGDGAGFPELVVPEAAGADHDRRHPRVLRGLGIAIITTSQGVMTDKEARRRGIGGEVLCYVW